MIDTHYEIIETKTSSHKVKWISFEEIDTPVVDWFPLASRFMRYKTKIHSHVLIKVVWYFPLWECIIIVLSLVDFAYDTIKYGFPIAGEKLWQALCWLFSQLWNMMVAVCSRIWEVIGESVKAFLVTLLKGLAAVMVILLVVAFIKAGSFTNLIDSIPRWLGF